MIPGMAKVAIWVGAALALLGAALGFVRQGECGSVFDPRNSSYDNVNRMFGGDVPDCTTALDLTVPVWLLIIAGAVTAFVGVVVAMQRQETADSHDAIPSGNDTP